jgi:bHLH factor
MTMSSGKGILCIQPTCPGHKVGKKGNKSYALRECSIKKRKEVEGRKNQPRKRGPKPRPKTAPMSKYRRKTANLRERLRMGEINTAFENLREKLPNPVQSGKGKCEKLTKINILHVAINYIRAMENLLETGDSGIRSFSEMTKNPLRDENDSKIEMQKILAVLMKKAEAKAAAAMSGDPGTNPEPRPRKKSSKKFGTDSENSLFVMGSKKKIKSEIKEEFDEDFENENDDFDQDTDDDLDDYDDEMDQDQSLALDSFPDWKSLSSTLLPFPNTLPTADQQNFSKPISSSTPKSIRSSTMFPSPTATCSSSTSSSPSSTSFSSSDSGCMLVPNLQNHQQQPDPLFASVNFPSASASSSTVQNSDEMIKEFFTEFVDMVDTLPDIDFEEHFEMFP